MRPVQSATGSASEGLIAIGYTTGKFVLLKLHRAAVIPAVPPAAPAAPVNIFSDSRKSSVVESTAKRSRANSTKSIMLSATSEQIDILEAVVQQKDITHRNSVDFQLDMQLEVAGIAPPQWNDAGDDDDNRSETSEVSLQQNQQGRQHHMQLGGSDDESLGGEVDNEGLDPKHQSLHSNQNNNVNNELAPINNQARRISIRRKSVATSNTANSNTANDSENDYNTQNSNSLFSHTVELSTTFCPLSISDIFFSTSGGFVALCHIKKIVVVFNNNVDAKKMSLKVSFEDMFCGISALVPSQLTAEQDREASTTEAKSNNNRRRDTRKSSFTTTGLSGTATAVASGLSTSASNRIPQPQPQPHTQPQQVDDESLILLLQSPTQIRLLDAIKGTVLTEFDLHTGGVPVVSSAAWDIPVLFNTALAEGGTDAELNKNVKTKLDPRNTAHASSTHNNSSINNINNNNNERAITGLCVAQDMRIFLFGEDSGQFHQHRLHDQHPAAAYLQHNALHQQSSLHYNSMSIRSFSKLDNLVQGVCVNELAGYSPLATVWSLRRLVLLRVQLLNQRGAEVLRSEEYVLGPDNVRIIFASALRARPRMRNHRAVLVLSNGHVIVMHL